MTQDEFRELYKKINKNWNDSVSIYKDMVSREITSNSVVLEAGCGFSSLYEAEYKRAKRVIGVDISEEYLNANKFIQEKIVSDLSNFPQVKDNSIDLIVSSWVLEHLENPEKVFGEFSRVLKKGGKIVFITPNSYNYVVFLNKLIPSWFRNMVARRLSGNTLTVDPMKTFYRINTISRIKKLSKKFGLTSEKIILNGDPTYVAINKLFFWIGLLVEVFLSLRILKESRVHIIGVLKKG